MDVNFDLATSLAITTLVVGIVFLARLINGSAGCSDPWPIGRS
jgi:hypothetical protein